MRKDRVKELFLSVIIFFLVERTALILSAYSVDSTQDILIARRRAQIELIFLTAAFALTWYLLKA